MSRCFGYYISYIFIGNCIENRVLNLKKKTHSISKVTKRIGPIIMVM